MKKKSPNNKTSLNNLMLLVQGHSAFQLLWAGVQLKVFDLLNEKPNRLSFRSIAENIGLEKIPCKILLDGLLTLKLITRNKKTGALNNVKQLEKYLISKSPVNWIGVLGWQKHIVYPGVIDFVDSLKKNKNIGLRQFRGKGKTLYERLIFQPALEKIFQDGMQSLSDSSNYFLIKQLQLKQFKHLLDFGGGNGTNAISIAKKNPHLKITVFDMKSICERAKTNINKNNLSRRIDTLNGNMFTTKLPKSIDCVLYSHIVTIWSPEKNIQLFKHIYNSLPTGGQIYVFSTLSNDNGIGPITSVVGSVYFQAVATGEAMIYTKKEVADFLKKGGFQRVKIIKLPLDHTLCIGIKK